MELQNIDSVNLPSTTELIYNISQNVAHSWMVQQDSNNGFIGYAYDLAESPMGIKLWLNGGVAYNNLPIAQRSMHKCVEFPNISNVVQLKLNFYCPIDTITENTINRIEGYLHNEPDLIVATVPNRFSNFDNTNLIQDITFIDSHNFSISLEGSVFSNISTTYVNLLFKYNNSTEFDGVIRRVIGYCNKYIFIV